MNIDRLLEFLTISETKSFKKTAEMMNISAAVLSARIAVLEKSLGVKLLLRDAHRVELTDAGLQFLPDAQRIVGSVEQLKRRFKTIGSNTYRSLRIALSGTLMPPKVGPYLDFVNGNHPDIHLELLNDASFDVPGGLNEDLCDIFLTYGTSELHFDGIERQLIYSSQTCVLVNKSDPLAYYSHVHMQDLDGRRFILYPKTSETAFRDLELKMLNSAMISYSLYEDTVSPEFYRWLVPIGKGVSFFPWVSRETMPPNTAQLAIDDAADSFNMYLFYRKDSQNPFLPEFLEGLDKFDLI